MNLKYRIKKAWFGFWQKYKLDVQLKIAAKLFLVFLAVWIIGSLLTILSQWIFISNDATPFHIDNLKYFWTVIIELISGFDVDEEGLHVVSRIISVIILLTGVVIFAVFTGQVVSMFVHIIQRTHHLPEKPGTFKFERPILICGINKRLDKVIEELKNNNLSDNREIIVIDENADDIKVEDKKRFKDVWYTKGNQADREILKKVLGERETAAIILSQERENKKCDIYSDSRAIETALAIEGFSEKIHTVVELSNEQNMPHLKYTKINECINICDYGIKLISQTALQNGIAMTYHYLLGGAAGDKNMNQIYFTRCPLPGKMVGMTYEDIRNTILSLSSLDITLIGFAKYVDERTNKRLGLNLINTSFIKQLNPVGRRCMACGSEIVRIDELGRVLKKCPRCFKKEQLKNSKASNRFYFPKDTIIKEKDQLIYLAENEFEFSRLFDNKIGH